MNGLLEGKSGRILWGIVQILLMFLGNLGESKIFSLFLINRLFSLGNFLTLIVLNHRLMRKCAVNNLLQGLAISDIVAPSLASIPQIIFYYGLRVNGKIIHLINVYLIPIATGATFCSNWIGKDILNLLFTLSSTLSTLQSFSSFHSASSCSSSSNCWRCSFVNKTRHLTIRSHLLFTETKAKHPVNCSV